MALASAKFTQAQIKAIHRENLKWPITLTQVLMSEWPAAVFDGGKDILIDYWRSRAFSVQVFHQKSHGDILRLSIQRTEYDERTKRFRDGISWEDLQRLKSEAGYGDRCAVEVFPPNNLVIDVANIRHLFLFPEGHVPSFVWQ